jgi:hypothetical protein
MTMVSKYCHSLNKPLLHTLLTTFMNGIGGVAYAKKKPLRNNALISFSNPLFPSFLKTWSPPSLSLKKKPSARLNNLSSFILNQDVYIWYYLMPQDPCHSARTNLGCLTPRMDLSVPLHTTIHTYNNHLCMEHLSIHRYM